MWDCPRDHDADRAGQGGRVVFVVDTEWKSSVVSSCPSRLRVIPSPEVSSVSEPGREVSLGSQSSRTIPFLSGQERCLIM